MKYRIGQELYDVTVNDEGACEVDVWKVRTIRGGKITAIYFAKWTWVKLSKKNGDFGWAKSIDPIWRKTWQESEASPLHKTKLLAWKDALVTTKYLDEPFLSRAIQTIQSQITRLSNKPQKDLTR